jgi:hypothetical protein
MNSKFLRLLLTVMVAMVLILGASLAMAQDKAAAPAEAKKASYVGSKACKMCHQGEKKGKQWEIWMESKHSKSMAALDSSKGETTNAKCLKCHTTGYTAGGYGEKGMEAMMGTDGLGAVGCEACHGPGSAYKSMTVMKDKAAAVAAGLVIPDEKVCVKCHNEESPTFKKDHPFVFADMVKLISHKIPPAEAPAGK